MAEFVENIGRYVFDPANGTVATVMAKKDADGRITEHVTHITTVQIFLKWCAAMRAAEAEIMQHIGRQNVFEMSDYRDQADTA